MKSLWLMIGMIAFSANAIAQQTLRLQDAIEQMKQNNTQLKVQQLAIDLNTQERAGSSSAFMPRVAVSHTGFFTNDPLNAFGFKLQQKIVAPQHFDPKVLNHPGSVQQFNSKISVQQPLLNFDVYNARKALKEKIAASQYQKVYAEFILEAEIKKSYTQLQFLYQAQKAVHQGLSAYSEVLRNTINLEQQGYAKPTDVMMVKVALLETQNKALDIESNIINLSNYLSWLMGVDAKVVYQPEHELSPAAADHQPQNIPENRADVLAMKSGIAALEQMVTLHKRSLLPRLNAFGEWNAYHQNPVNYKSNAYFAGVSLTWDLFNGNERHHNIKQSKLQVEKAKADVHLHIEKSALELQKAERDLITHRSGIELAEAAKIEAAESLRIMQNRFDQGLEKTSELLIAQAKSLEKETAWAEAVKDLQLTMIQIELLTRQ